MTPAALPVVAPCRRAYRNFRTGAGATIEPRNAALLGVFVILSSRNCAASTALRSASARRRRWRLASSSGVHNSSSRRGPHLSTSPAGEKGPPAPAPPGVTPPFPLAPTSPQVAPPLPPPPPPR